MKKKVSIVLPVYNEKENLEKFALSLLRFCKDIPGYHFDIIISDSHSTDGTSEIAKNLTRKYKNIHYIDGKPGIGMGLYNGLKYAIRNIKPDILIQMDADGQADKRVILSLIKTLEDGYDLALGSRFLNGGKNGLSSMRKIFSLGSSMCCRMVMGPWDLQEFTNSARAFTPKTFKKMNWKNIPLQRKTFIALPAQLNEAILAGATYKEVPLVFKDRPSGHSKNKIVAYMFDMLVYIIDVRLNKWNIRLPLYKMIYGD